MKKLTICLISLVLIICSLTAPVSAAAVDNGPDVQPMWENTNTVDVSVYFENNVGTAYSALIAELDVRYIFTSIYVYRVSGDDLIYENENHEIIRDFVGDTTCTFTAIRGATYKIDYVFRVRRNGVDEVINRTIYGTYTSNYN